MTWFTLLEMLVHKTKYCCITKHLYGIICKFIMSVHEPPYQTTVVCCNFIYHHGSLYMGHHAILHIRVEIT